MAAYSRNAHLHQLAEEQAEGLRRAKQQQPPHQPTSCLEPFSCRCVFITLVAQCSSTGRGSVPGILIAMARASRSNPDMGRVWLE